MPRSARSRKDEPGDEDAEQQRGDDEDPTGLDVRPDAEQQERSEPIARSAGRGSSGRSLRDLGVTSCEGRSRHRRGGPS